MDSIRTCRSLILAHLAMTACSDGGEYTSHNGTDAETSETISDTTHETDIGAETYLPDNCRVVGDSGCTDGCEPVITTSQSFSTPCILDGVFFGCVPERGSLFWSQSNIVTTDFGKCDVLKDDPAQELYCFEGREALYWYYKNIDLFCQGQCPALPGACGQR